MKKIFAIMLTSIILLLFVGCEETMNYIEEDIFYTLPITQSVEPLLAECDTETEEALVIVETQTLYEQTTLLENTAEQPETLPFASQTVEVTEIIEEAKETTQADYVLNTNSKVFHYPSCKSVGKMKEKNKKYFVGTRDEAVTLGYKSCGNCHP